MADSPKPPPSGGVPTEPRVHRPGATVQRPGLGFGETPPPSQQPNNFASTVVHDPQYGNQTSSPKHPYLTIITGANAGEVTKLPAGQTTLGRSPDSTLRIDSEGVSMRHARIFSAGNQYLLEDCKSTNGTGVNDKRVDMHVLVDGDRIHLGPGMLVRFNMYDELEAGVQVQLYESAVKDPLTRAYNRKHFGERMRSELGYAARHRMPLSMILFDIDFFKKVNDTYGHPGGDAVLRAVSAGVATAVRTEDVFARVGGEEFAILARSIDVAQAWGFAERLRLGIQHLVVPWENGQIPITASFGVAELSELPQPDGDALVALADRRLYEAKGGGRNRVVGPR
jgi:two-component system cell cycle response regulator